MSPAASSIGSEPVVRSNAPFSGLVICVTGLSKEARKQVMEATERLGGHFGGRKFEHALKHGSRNGLSIVTIGWFVDSVGKNVRLSESLYSIKSFGQNGIRLDELNRLVGFSGTENSCLPVGANGTKHLSTIEEAQFSERESNCNRSSDSTLSGHSMYIDLDISAELRNKVIQAAGREGATFIDQWFVGCRASHVVCEGSSSRKYLGHSSNIVTPLWVLKTVKEKYVQRLVHMSADLARQVGMMLEDLQNGIADEETTDLNVPEDAQTYRNKANHEKRQQIVSSAKTGVRNRRGLRMQTCQTPMRPLTPSSLLDSICWSISEPTSTASIYTETFSSEDFGEPQTPVLFDAKGDGKTEASFANLTRPLKESEKSEMIFKNHFLTILFPIDRFAEMGPSSRTFISNDGFTCLQVLDHIYAFYQENMSVHEIEAAIHTDSRHADRLRSVYASKETAEHGGYVIFKRIDFLGSRRSFEMLRRVNGDNNSNVYELLVRA
ncbi:hypothetical protein M0R45_012229 [Rubus argutus]|uniref:BRCT domain-containing protein n=1 Tax=Rubus argutus TaxID=59490 RepID=A0AAW1YGS8_RUBAR